MVRSAYRFKDIAPGVVVALLLFLQMMVPSALAANTDALSYRDALSTFGSDAADVAPCYPRAFAIGEDELRDANDDRDPSVKAIPQPRLIARLERGGVSRFTFGSDDNPFSINPVLLLTQRFRL